MRITICGSLKFNKEMMGLKEQLESNGHKVFMPVAVDGLDYWDKDSTKKIRAKKELRLVETHLDKITESDAILVANYSKGGVENYIGANTFIEMGYAQYKNKKIFVINPLPDQDYIKDELLSFDCMVINGDLSVV